ncbi:MAG: nitroreductase family deazaflavin-dependent oxidoreductase [Ktedonobacteraceae bacterium]|nr:nitroreductase family deazaflavin-dependent oxidoreductase [Ktedonobacteraceae bacterium]
MAKTSQIPMFVQLGNILTRTLLRAGVKMVAPGGHRTYLLTVRGRKSGQPRTTPITVIELEGKRYLMTPFGVVDWVRNLRAAGEAVLTRGRRAEKVRAAELPESEGGPVLKRCLEGDIPSILRQYFEVTPQSSREDFEHAARIHPVFLLQVD